MSSIRSKLAATESKLARMPGKQEDHPADLTHFQEEQLFHIDLNLIQPNPEQPRQHFDPEALTQLAESVREKGVLEPVLVRHGDDDQIYLVAGDRRLRAAKMAGLGKIPAIFTTGDPMEIAIIENVQRENLKPLEEAEALQRLADKHNYTLEKLSAVIRKAPSTVSEKLRLNRLPEEIKDEVRHSDYPLRMLVEIAKQETPEAMIDLYNKVKEGGLTSAEVRKIARGKRPGKKQRTPVLIVRTRARGLVRYLDKLDIAAIGEDDKPQLRKELETARARIEDMLTRIL